MTYLDTHVLVLLYLGRIERLGKAAQRAIDSGDLVASPAAVLELEFLHEIGRLKPTATAVLAALEEDFGVRVCGLPFRTTVEHALPERWGRDPFDRLIVANAKAAGAALVSKDEKIRQHYRRTIW